MSGPSKGKSSKHNTESTNRRPTPVNASTLILAGVKEAAALSPFQELKRAATVTLEILHNVNIWARKNSVTDNREALERLGDDSGGLILVIWRSYKKSQVPNEWLSMEMREILQELTHTLENISSFVQAQLSRSKAIRVIFSKTDAGKISEYREHLNYAMQRFELQSHMNINDVLMRLVRLSGQILDRNGEQEDVRRTLEITAREARDREEAERIHKEELERAQEISALEQRLKQAEIDKQDEDERRRSDKLQQLEMETKLRQSELERLRATASALDLASRLKKEQEEEIAALKRKIEAEEQSATVQAQSSKTKSSVRRVEIEEEEDEDERWTGDVRVEEATSEEEEKVRKPARKSSKLKVNSSKPPMRRPVAVDNSDDSDYSRTSRSSKMKTARRKSNASLRAEETTEDEYTDDYSTDEEDIYAPPRSRKRPQINTRLHSSSASLLRDLDEMMDQFGSFTPLGLGSPLGSRPGSRPNSRPSSPSFFGSPPIGPYGYMPGMVVNSGVGNITNSIISNVGNDNSVRMVYR